MKHSKSQNIYGGIIYLPQHKYSDMHGLLRCIIRAKGQKRAIELLSRWGIEVVPRDFGRTWSLSKSVVEEQATFGHSHEPLVCALPCCYLRVEFYEPLRREPKSGPVDPGVPARPARSRGDTGAGREFFGLERERLGEFRRPSP